MLYKTYLQPLRYAQNGHGLAQFHVQQGLLYHLIRRIVAVIIAYGVVGDGSVEKFR